VEKYLNLPKGFYTELNKINTVVPMDFALFMERYGYKILFAIFGAIILVIFGVVALSVYSVLKLYGLIFGAMILLSVAVYAFFVQRRALNAYGEAHGKYFYDPKYGKKP